MTSISKMYKITGMWSHGSKALRLNALGAKPVDNAMPSSRGWWDDPHLRPANLFADRHHELLYMLYVLHARVCNASLWGDLGRREDARLLPGAFHAPAPEPLLMAVMQSIGSLAQRTSTLHLT